MSPVLATLFTIYVVVGVINLVIGSIGYIYAGLDRAPDARRFHARQVLISVIWPVFLAAWIAIHSIKLTRDAV